MSKEHELATVASAIHALEFAHNRIEQLEREKEEWVGKYHAALRENAELRNATLEEAAQSADEWGDSEVDPGRISKEIRSLKT